MSRFSVVDQGYAEVMRLIEGLIVHRINHEAGINHANRSRSPRRPQVTVTIGAMRTPVTLASPATDGRNGCSDLARKILAIAVAALDFP